MLFSIHHHPDILFHWHTDVEMIYVHEGKAQFHIDDDYFNSEKGDIILIAGKGHETYQEIKGVRHHFDDFEIVREFLELYKK